MKDITTIFDTKGSTPTDFSHFIDIVVNPKLKTSSDIYKINCICNFLLGVDLLKTHALFSEKLTINPDINPMLVARNNDR